MNVRAHSPLWRRSIRILARQLFRWAENNDNPRPARNGETWLLRSLLAAHVRVGAGRPFVVFDAGANVGDYSRMVVAEARRAGCAVELHGFEPSPWAVAALRRAFGSEPAMRIVGAALGDRAGSTPLHGGETGSSQASLIARPGHATVGAAAVTVPVIRLDDYLEQNGVARVDLLKLDVEGSELAALRGLGGRLNPECVGVIQFEYGGTALDAGTTLREHYRLLEARGFTLAKLFPAALELRGYRAWMEHYAYANYVALPSRGPTPPAPGP